MSLVYNDAPSKVLFKLMFNCGQQEKPSILTSRTLSTTHVWHLCCQHSFGLPIKRKEKIASNFLSIFLCENKYTVTWYKSGISLVGVYERGTTGKNNGFPFLDILGYLKNTHKNPKFGKVRQVPTREFPTKFPDWDLSHSSKFGIFLGIL